MGFTFQAGTFNIDQSGEGLTALQYTYSDNEQFTVALRVRDDDAVSTVATAAVVVNNVVPTANAGGPYQGAAGSPISFSGSATDPGNDTLTYEWDFDYDGATFDTVGDVDSGVDLTGPTHSYTNDGVFTVALRVQDDDSGFSTIATAQVTVAPLGDPTPTPTPAPAPPPPPPPPPAPQPMPTPTSVPQSGTTSPPPAVPTPTP